MASKLAIVSFFHRTTHIHLFFALLMIILYEIIKIVFLLLTVLIAIFFLRGNYILPDQTFSFVGEILLPLYLLLCGVMVGYIVAQVMLAKGDETTLPSRIYVKSFTIGIIIGIISALLYIFFG